MDKTRRHAPAKPTAPVPPAEILHLLGLDHKKLTFRFGGRDVRLTDVSGEVLTGILR